MSVSCSHIKDGLQIRHQLKNKHITGYSIPLMGLSLPSLPILNLLLLPQLGVKALESVGGEDMGVKLTTEVEKHRRDKSRHRLLDGVPRGRSTLCQETVNAAPRKHLGPRSTEEMGR